MLSHRYRPSLALLTDLYQLTMGHGYWAHGMHEARACFHLFYRKAPFGGAYAIAAGLEDALDLLTGFSLDEEDTEYLRSLIGADGKPLFASGFVDYLANMQLSLDVDAMPEGTVALPHEPLLRVEGPLLQAQLLETALLNIVNFQTLIATKASRVVRAAAGDEVLEFGLRRAQGPDGGLSASRAAYVGGCKATSNVLAGRLYGIPVKGTHAHSWVMAFETESEAFERYAAAMPNNCVFLVDTYDTLEGVRRACAVGKRLREQGNEMLGVRLDSGDLAELSKGARSILDSEGFPNAKVIASDSLDERKVAELKRRGARIDVWGVGTRLVTAKEQPALGGVYKLAAMQQDDGSWDPRIKLSSTPIKVSNPGRQQVTRFIRDGKLAGDVIHGLNESAPSQLIAWDQQSRALSGQAHSLLTPQLRNGEKVCADESLEDIAKRAERELAQLPESALRFDDAEQLPCGLSPELDAAKRELVASAGKGAK